MTARVAPLVTAMLLSACAPVVRDSGESIGGARWLLEQRSLGAGVVTPANVSRQRGVLHLAARGADRTGAAVRTRETFAGGDFRASLRCSAPRGAVCAFFLYEPDAGDDADEIDIELIAGTRTVWLTTWVAGERTNHVALELPFDPATAFHVYEIRWSEGRVAFAVDGVRVAEFDRGVPGRDMALYTNAWWPRWLEPTARAGALEVEWIETPGGERAIASTLVERDHFDPLSNP